MAFESLAGKLNVALHMLCTFIVFMFLVTSAPISQFRGKGATNGHASKTTCLTAWGIKNECTKNNYDLRPASSGCKKIESLFQATEAFYIISVIVALVECILSGVFFLGIKTKIPLIALSVFELIAALIPWVLMTAVWYQNPCGGSKALHDAYGYPDAVPYGKVLRDNYQTSAGYGLTVAAWCISIIGLIVLCAVTK